MIYCPLGAPHIPGVVSACKADNHNDRTISTAFTPYEPKFGDGRTGATQKQILAGLELNYKPSDTIDITSVTSFYKSKFRLSNSSRAILSCRSCSSASALVCRR